MAGANETPETVVKKRNDAYTGLLAISFLAMTGGAVLLFLEYQNYEGKTPPKTLNVDVPGVQIKELKGTGGAPKPIEIKQPMEEPMPMKDPDMKMQLPPANSRPGPFILPTETVEAVKPPLPAQPSGLIQIPDVPPTTSVVIPAAALAPVPVKPAPIIPMAEPSLTDAPPVPTQRFEPPM